MRTAGWTNSSGRWMLSRTVIRLDEYGFWGAGMKELFYGILSRQSKSEKNWKRDIKQELKSEDLHVLKVH